MHALYIYNIRVYRVFLDILAIVHDYFHVSGIWEGGGGVIENGKGKGIRSGSSDVTQSYVSSSGLRILLRIKCTTYTQK